MTLKEILEANDITEDELQKRLEESQKLQALSRQQLQEHYKNKSFHDVLKNLPEKGTILYPLQGDVVTVKQDYKQDKGSPMEVRLCKMVVDTEGTGWFLSSENKGVTCLISMHSFDKVLQLRGQLYVSALEVIRISKTGRSVICKAL